MSLIGNEHHTISVLAGTDSGRPSLPHAMHQNGPGKGMSLHNSHDLKVVAISFPNPCLMPKLCATYPLSPSMGPPPPTPHRAGLANHVYRKLQIVAEENYPNIIHLWADS